MSDAFTAIGNAWVPVVINGFGSSAFDDFKAWIGAPDPITGGTGRYNPIVAKPAIAICGANTNVEATLTAMMAGREADLANVVVPACGSAFLPVQIAANAVINLARSIGVKPNTDVLNMPLPLITDSVNGSITDDYEVRNRLVKAGISTTVFDRALGFILQDLITGRRVSDEGREFKYVRDLFIDWNILYRYQILQARELWGKTLITDADVVDGDVSASSIKPLAWKALVISHVESCGRSGLIANVAEAAKTVKVQIGAVDSELVETYYEYSRTGIGRRAATQAVAKSYYGGN